MINETIDEKVQNTIKICAGSRSVKLNYLFNPEKTILIIKQEISKLIDVNNDMLVIIARGKPCMNDNIVKSYLPCIFIVLLRSNVPNHNVFNFRLIQKLKGEYIPITECCVCLDNKPNISNAGCDHDSVLCSNCLFQLKQCPICNADLNGLQQLYI